MGFRTPNGIIIRHHLGAIGGPGAGSFRRPKPLHRRDSWEEGGGGSAIHLQTHKHGHAAGPPKFREHGRAKFAPTVSHGYRH